MSDILPLFLEEPLQFTKSDAVFYGQQCPRKLRFEVQLIFGPVGVLVERVELSFDLIWGEVVERRVLAVMMVVGVDIVEEFQAGVSGVFKTAIQEHLAL